MDPICIGRKSQIDAVIDDEQRSVLATPDLNGLGFLKAVTVVSAFASVLDHANATLQCRLHPFEQIVDRRCDQAQAAVLQLAATVSSMGGIETADLQVVKPITDRC